MKSHRLSAIPKGALIFSRVSQFRRGSRLKYLKSLLIRVACWSRFSHVMLYTSVNTVFESDGRIITQRPLGQRMLGLSKDGRMAVCILPSNNDEIEILSSPGTEKWVEDDPRHLAVAMIEHLYSPYPSALKLATSLGFKGTIHYLLQKLGIATAREENPYCSMLIWNVFRNYDPAGGRTNLAGHISPSGIYHWIKSQKDCSSVEAEEWDEILPPTLLKEILLEPEKFAAAFYESDDGASFLPLKTHLSPEHQNVWRTMHISDFINLTLASAKLSLILPFTDGASLPPHVERKILDIHVLGANIARLPIVRQEERERISEQAVSKAMNILQDSQQKEIQAPEFNFESQKEITNFLIFAARQVRNTKS